jgi:hypothetical protein
MFNTPLPLDLEWASRVRRMKRGTTWRYYDDTAPRGSGVPRVNHFIGGQVADSIDLERLQFGEVRSDHVFIDDKKLHSSVAFWKNGKILALGPHALAMAMAAVAFLARTGIAPNASLASLKSIDSSIIGRGRNANL